MPWRRPTLSVLAALCAGCGGVDRIALVSQSGAPNAYPPAGSVPLEVVTRGTAVPDPLRVRGAAVAYGEVEAALGLAVSSAGVPWAEAHRAARPGGWQLAVDLTRADAEEDAGRLIVTLDVRATLRARDTRAYIAQTQAHCRQAGLVDPAAGGPVVYACMSRLGRDLASWLGAVEP